VKAIPESLAGSSNQGFRGNRDTQNDEIYHFQRMAFGYSLIADGRLQGIPTLKVNQLTESTTVARWTE
jgi:hypothetical protein